MPQKIGCILAVPISLDDKICFCATPDWTPCHTAPSRRFYIFLCNMGQPKTKLLPKLHLISKDSFIY